MSLKLNLSEINLLSESEFERTFENIIEHYSKTAKHLFLKRPFTNAQEIYEIVLIFIDELNTQDKEIILKLHPDLAGKLSDEGRLTNESTQEQKAAGLDKLTIFEKQQLNNLNTQYKLKFGFPFVICARENKAASILSGLKTRLNNRKEEELLAGIEEVKKICKLRLLDILDLDN